MHRILPAALLSFAAALATSPAQNLTSANALRIHFTVSPPYNRQPDVLRINFGLTQVHSAYTNRRAVLWDCDQQLGTYASPLFGAHTGALNLDPGASFKSPTSPWTFDNAGTADFTSIVNGAIRGVIDFTIDTGAMNIPLHQVNLNMVQATSSAGGFVVTPDPTVTLAQIVPRLEGPSPGTPNGNNTWTVTGATPNSVVFLGIGTQCMPLPVLDTIWDIADPAVFLPIPTDASGSATFTAFVPPQLAGRRLLVQGTEVLGAASLVATTLSAHTF